MYNIIALIGPSGAGKDTIKNNLLKLFPKNTYDIIKTTTREKRKNEIDGKDYYFVSRENFSNKVLNEEMIIASVFHKWVYGLEEKSMQEKGVGIGVFNLTELETLYESSDFNLLVVNVITDDKERLKRSLNRDTDCSEICRRFLADKDDFARKAELIQRSIKYDNTREKIHPNDIKNYSQSNKDTLLKIKNFIDNYAVS